jgi:hypothetical protein
MKARIMAKRMIRPSKGPPPPPEVVVATTPAQEVRAKEPESAAVQDRVVNIASDPAFVFQQGYSTAITLHCSDGRFTRAIEALLKSEQVERYDIVAMPGGPALLDMAGATILEAEATRAGLSFLIQSHAIQDAFLIAHAGCGFYKKRLAGQAPDKIYDRQVKDLQAAAAWIRRVFPRVNVRAFMALIDGPPEYDEARVSFERIEIDPTATTLLL